jgi:CBS domain containing-hemolysin-like protein
VQPFLLILLCTLIVVLELALVVGIFAPRAVANAARATAERAIVAPVRWLMRHVTRPRGDRALARVGGGRR